MKFRLKAAPYDIAAGLLSGLATFSLAWLGIHQQDSFHTVALDLAKFDQAIWNIAHGRLFQITLGESNVLTSHFSPALALLAPAYWLWSDIRLLAILQAVLMVGAGAVLYWFVREEHPWLALAVLAAFLMQPALHQVYLAGFRRETLAIFTTALTLFFMLRRRYGWMLAGLAITLLCKEDMAFLCLGVGLYLALAQQARKLGVALALVGLAYVVVVPLVIMPAISGQSYALSEAYFGYLGSSPLQMVTTALTQPDLWLHYLLMPARLAALGRFLLPSLGLFALAPELAAFLLPFLAYMLLSGTDALGLLTGWYPSVLLVLLFWAVAVGARRLPRHWQTPAAAALVAVGLGCWLAFSPLWPGRNFQPADYHVTAHNQQVDAVLADIPASAAVAAQDELVPHLSQRQSIYLLPWLPAQPAIDDFAFDRDSHSTYPLSADEYRTLFYNYLADPAYPIMAQVDQFYLFGRAGAWQPEVDRQDTWNQALTLTGYSVALAAPGNSFQVTGSNAANTLTARVTLFWRMDTPIGRNVSPFVQLLDARQQVVAQSESWPADGFRPTGVQQMGEQVRDIRYLTWSAADALNTLALRIGLDDSQASQPLALADGQAYIVVPLQP